MRPRVFPAEDRLVPLQLHLLLTCFNEAAGIPRGRLALVRGLTSHRPRFNEAAGIPRGRPVSYFDFIAVGPRGASMRPRVFPAEDLHHRPSHLHSLPASMRPRVFPAEDLPVQGTP